MISINRLRLTVILVGLGYSSLAQPVCKEAQDLYPFSIGSNWGFINPSGRVVVAAKYDLTESSSEGFAKIWIKGELGFVDKRGALRFRVKGGDASTGFSEGLAAVRINHKWGFVNEEGSIVIEPKYDSALPFAEGLAAVREGNEWQYIDRTGRSTLRPRAAGWDGESSLSSFHDGRARLGSTNGKFGYIDRHGSWAIQPRFEYVEQFSNGLGQVEVGGRWGYIDRSGSLAIPTNFVWVSPFSEGLAAVSVNDSPRSVGFIDKNGRIVIAPRFDQAHVFCSGLAAVQVDGLYGYINHEGAMVIPPQFEEASDFAGDLAFVITHAPAQLGYVRKDGKFAWVSDEPPANFKY